MSKMKKYFFLFSILLLPLSVQAEGFSVEDSLRVLRELSHQAENAKDLREKAMLADKGLKGADQCVKSFSGSAGCYYFRGVHRGLKISTQIRGFAENLRLMESDFLKSLELDPRFENAGAYRALADLYRQLPQFGFDGEFMRDLQKAKGYSDQALQFFPDEIENLLVRAQIAEALDEKVILNELVKKLQTRIDKNTSKEIVKQFEKLRRKL